MPGAITPSRRSRSAYSDDEDEESLYADGSARSKRARVDVDNDSQADDGYEQNHRPPLPDSYLRSPHRTQRSVDGPGSSNVQPSHQPGSIVRVSLKNFVTYTDTEFFPGPNLNMIIGPNGTGKSTLVCAICLGLGWNTSHLGRAKDISEFVKHGAKHAAIEIELAADRERHGENPVITCRISRESGKTEFLINGKKSNKKSAQELARSFNIQVDNLCQFLPQDRVVEFAAMNPVELLAQTQKAAAPEYMTDWHERLKMMRKEEKAQELEQQAGSEHLKSMQDRQKSQEGEVGRLRERTVLQQRHTALEKMKPFGAYNTCKRKHLEAKKNKKEAVAELRKLERKTEPRLRDENAKRQYVERLQASVQHRQRLMTRAEADAGAKFAKCEEADAQIAQLEQEIDAERKNSRKAAQDIPRLVQDLQRLQKAIDSPPAPFDPSELNERYRELTKEIRSLDVKISENTDQMSVLREKERQRSEIIKQCESQHESLQSQAGRQTNKLDSASRDTARAWQWIQDNRERFAADVHGPAMIECSVRNPRYADQVETVIGRSELLAITVTCEADFKLLQRELLTNMKLSDVNIRSSIQPLASFQSPCSEDELQQFGLDSWLLDQIEGPEAVLAMICDNRSIHQTGFSSRDLNNAQSQKLERSALNSWVTPKDQCMITRRREYGDAGVSTRFIPVKKASLLTDAPVDMQIEQRINRKLNEMRSDIAEIHAGMKELEQSAKAHQHEIDSLRETQHAVQEEKSQKQRQQSEYNGLAVKKEKLESSVAKAREKASASRSIVMGKLDEGDELSLAKGQLALDYSRTLDALRTLHEQLLEAEIIEIEAKSDFQQMCARHEEERRQLEDLRTRVEQTTRHAQELFAQGHQMGQQCYAVVETFTPFESDLHGQITNWESDKLEDEIQSVEAQLESLHGGNDNIIREYDQRARKIEEKQTKLAELAESLEHLHAEVDEIRQRWEPQLDNLIGQISGAFSENFSRIQCAGEVAVHKDEDFDLWAIQIKVKFREQEELSVLDSHRQSGGERAVSTIFYLMALQSLAVAPFRVVDEINQGMDPRNERLVHSRMVAIACAEHTSQYFLITPKLLNGLDYHPNMKVHCIASGEYMPGNHRELDFSSLAQRALAVRAKNLAAVAS